MSHLRRLQRSRNNTSLACTNCRMNHQRCIRLPEGICTYCRKYKLTCVYIPGRKRGPKTNSSSLSNINPGETAIKALFSLNDSSAFETPNPYNHNIISPNIHNGTTETFQNTSIDQSSLPSFFPFVHEELTQNNDPTTLSSTSHLEGSSSAQTPFNIHLYRVSEIFPNNPPSDHEGPTQNDDPLTVSPSQNSTPSSIIYLNDSSSLETSNPYNNIIISLNIDNYEINDAFQNAFIDQSFLHPFFPPDQSSLPSFFPFVHEELTQNNDSLIINPNQNNILSSTNHLEGSSSAQTPFNIYLNRVSEIFQDIPPSAHEGLVQNDDPLTISPSQNAIPTSIIHLNDSSPLEISDHYNNIITSPNINNYGTNESIQKAFIDQYLYPSSPFIHEGSMQNYDHLTTDLFPNVTSSFINHSNDSSSFETTDSNNNVIITPVNVHPYEATEVFQNMFTD
ncbi:35195_t:CDS:1 [Gigaspora margarita]|uniref:35195_t:CDS:1 n=1 Tax=Gigaspora margarita TaxID=4874 RepID=A0ABN7UGJ3_GIGMA|nr:35195_t:CDS:1 [Gigaspora margarita]